MIGECRLDVVDGLRVREKGQQKTREGKIGDPVGGGRSTRV